MLPTHIFTHRYLKATNYVCFLGVQVGQARSHLRKREEKTISEVSQGRKIKIKRQTEYKNNQTRVERKESKTFNQGGPGCGKLLTNYIK